MLAYTFYFYSAEVSVADTLATNHSLKEKLLFVILIPLVKAWSIFHVTFCINFLHYLLESPVPRRE